MITSHTVYMILKIINIKDMLGYFFFLKSVNKK